MKEFQLISRLSIKSIMTSLLEVHWLKRNVKDRLKLKLITSSSMNVDIQNNVRNWQVPLSPLHFCTCRVEIHSTFYRWKILDVRNQVAVLVTSLVHAIKQPEFIECHIRWSAKSVCFCWNLLIASVSVILNLLSFNLKLWKYEIQNNFE